MALYGVGHRPQLSRNGHGHIELEQVWQVPNPPAPANARIRMAGQCCMAGTPSTFAQKHLLEVRAGHSNEATKMWRRVWHRVDKAGALGGFSPNDSFEFTAHPDPTAKAIGDGRLPRGVKYGNKLKMATNDGDPGNSTIVLNLMSLEALLFQIALALGGVVPPPLHTRTDITIALVGPAPIKTTYLDGRIVGPRSDLSLGYMRHAANDYVILHLGH